MPVSETYPSAMFAVLTPEAEEQLAQRIVSALAPLSLRAEASGPCEHTYIVSRFCPKCGHRIVSQEHADAQIP